DEPLQFVDAACREVLSLIIQRLGESNFPAPVRLDDASWVGFRLAEVLPLETRVKQQLLEMDGAQERLARIREILVQEGLITKA
ncbi:MAG: LON peptidase substrate-binding domain-containing protein, partial [Burkholderiales bacterium]